jgi:hypothetical protein
MASSTDFMVRQLEPNDVALVQAMMTVSGEAFQRCGHLYRNPSQHEILVAPSQWPTFDRACGTEAQHGRNLSFGKLARRLIGGAGSGTFGIEEATTHTAVPLPTPCKPAPWNKGRLIGRKRPLKPKDVWAIRVRLQLQGRQ